MADSTDDPRYASLLARRVPREEIVPGVAYVIHARNGGVGIVVVSEVRIGYRLRRQKMGSVYLFTEWDWAEGAPHGTAIPLRALEGDPPAEDDALLAWLGEREEECREETRAAWEEILGPTAVAWRKWREERIRGRKLRSRGR